MVETRQTEEYERWFASLRDRVARARIDVRVRRLSLGLRGDSKSIGDGVFELRIDHGPGFRVYYLMMGVALILLLAGGDKASQNQDIARAKRLARELGD